MKNKIAIEKICIHCGNRFIAKTTVTKFCSQKCAARAYKIRKREEKIAQVKKEQILVEIPKEQSFRNKEFLTIAEACSLLSTSRMTIYRQIKKGRINALKLGRRTIIRKADIEKLFDLQLYHSTIK